MEIWATWLTLIENCMQFLLTQSGMSEAFAIIILTLLTRFLLLPLSYHSAYKMYKNKQAMQALKPELEQLKIKYKDSPEKLFKMTMSLYRKNGIKFIDNSTMLNLATQGVLGLGLYQTLKAMIFNSSFMWIGNLAKPDLILSLLIGLLTVLTMSVMPAAVEQSFWIFILVPLVISMVVFFSVPSALGIYLLTSNFVTFCQTVVLRINISRELAGNKL